MTRDELETIITSYLDSFTTMTLACSVGDEPWAAAVYYARQDLDLIFFSSPACRHSKAFAENRRAAAAIHGDYRGWKEIKGLQLEGTVKPIKGVVAVTRAFACYLKRYPFVSEFFSDPLSLGTGVARKVAKVQLYLFRPEAILYVNNEEAFGKRWKLEVKKGHAVGIPTQA
ncbi:MAG TPA: hypothetical protein VK463_05580 [Desulfomonilaceae bacterium]|nr:hypothetical protein [Desulfomonilaceae bacterium]